MHMQKICKFIIPELNKIRDLANFTDDEMAYFDMKAKDYTNVKIATELAISESKVSSLAKAVKIKIERVGI